MSKKVSLIADYQEKTKESAASSDDELTKSSSLDSSTFQSKSQIWSNASVVWERTTTGYRIVDLLHDRINSALDLISGHFVLEEPMCVATSLSKDPLSSECYRRLAKEKLVEGNSVCAIQEGKSNIVGVAVMSRYGKSHKEFLDAQGTALSLIMGLEKRLFNEVQPNNEVNDHDEYPCIYVLFVVSDHRGKGVGRALLRSCIAKTRSLDVSACIGVFSSNGSQRIARRLGFTKLGEMPYATYVAEMRPDNTFAGIPDGNYSLACMISRTEA